jgi:glyoxylase-like metal-dependent hydrolase (beta-lactamase superfamily II)
VNYRFEQLTPSAWAAIALDTGAAVGNAGIAGALVVDCGYSPAAGRDLRGHAGNAERLFITHADFDHYGGAQAFADLPILASEQTAATIREVGPGRVAGMKDEMETYLAELEEQDAPEEDKQQARAIAAEVPGLELTPPTETFTGERDLGGAIAIELGAAHTASDSIVWMPEERVLFAGDLIGVKGHLNLTRGFPTGNWLAFLDRMAELDPEHVVPGHGPPAGPEAISACRHYIETVVELAATPGDHEPPAAFDGWVFPEGFQQNIDALRRRSADGQSPSAR